MQLRFRRFELKLAHSWTIATLVEKKGRASCEVVFCELRDDDGVTGLGEAAPTARYQESVETVFQFFQRIDPGRLSFGDLPGSMAYLETVAPGQQSAKAALNAALLDGAARHAGQAVCDFLKLGFTEKRHVTSFTIGIDSPGMIRTKVEAAAAYPILKLKLGSPQDRQNLAALRAAAPDKTVRVDGNEAWTTKEEALANLEWLAKDGRIEFVEQPMPADTKREDWLWLRRRSPLPIFADESYHHAGDVAFCAECFDGVNVKLVKTGGVSGGYDALQAARRAGLKTMIGCMIESSLLISAAAHLAELADHLDLDGSLLITNDPYAGVTAENGMLSFAHAPAKSGLRVAARPAAI